MTRTWLAFIGGIALGGSPLWDAYAGWVMGTWMGDVWWLFLLVGLALLLWPAVIASCEPNATRIDSGQ